MVRSLLFALTLVASLALALMPVPAHAWGLAAHAGLDFRVSEKAAIRVDVRWIDIDSRVRVDGARMGTANIDPLVYGAAYVMKF